MIDNVNDKVYQLAKTQVDMVKSVLGKLLPNIMCLSI